jgi:hypothetical protein
MIEDYVPPAARIRSAYEAYLDDGGTDEKLSEEALKQDMVRSINTPAWQAGDIFRTVIKHHENKAAPYYIRTLKVAHNEYRFGHTIEELEALAMLHGVYKHE